MASWSDSSNNVDITREEVERIGEALKNEEFRKLLNDYVEELHDPEQQKLYQQEITQLEKERGYDVTFINPTASYVIKTSANGTKKAFVNICSNDNIEKPTSKSVSREGSKGLQWTLPHSLTPPREDVDRKGQRCQVFDVVFHPDTLYLANNNKAFATMVNNTACEAIETNFNVNLDCKNLKFPKMLYKGMVHPAMMRKEANDKPELTQEEKDIMEKVYESLPKVDQHPKVKNLKKVEDDTKYTIPTYLIKHRSRVELEEFTECRTAKINSAIPKELVIEINLPLLRSAADIVLDVMERTVQLVSEKPSKYKLFLTLPYDVDESAGNAKFDKDERKLVITLPVKRHDIFSLDINRYDSGVDSDHGSPSSTTPTEVLSDPSVVPTDSPCDNESEFRTKSLANMFLEPGTSYSLPEFSCHIYDNILAFTLHVKNVDQNSLSKLVEDDAVHIKFVTTSSGFYTINYACYVKLIDFSIDSEELSIEVWDNNIIMQVPLKPCGKPITSYLVGVDCTNLETKFIGNPVIVNDLSENQIKEKKQEEEGESLIANERTASEDLRNLGESNSHKKNNVTNPAKGTSASKAINIIGAVSESSGDELSYSYSPSKCKGILKRFASSRSSVSRSISESSIDDAIWVSSFENCNSFDSVIPEDGEVSASLKKTVRFNDVVVKQHYRFNSSILGQKKKNQRKANNKKRAQDRRHSESELSEVEDRKEGDAKTISSELNLSRTNKEKHTSDECKQNGSNSDIFDLDI